MGRKSLDVDRYLVQRGEVYQYHRKVPAIVGEADSRAPKIRASLKTDDIALARVKRDALERADDELWASLTVGDGANGALLRHQSAVRRAEAMGFTYRAATALVSQGADVGDLLRRIEALGRAEPASATGDAVLGMAGELELTVTQAFDVYVREIMPADLVGKSEVQRSDWKKVKQRAVNNFVALEGDLAMSAITREHARDFYVFWLGRVAPEKRRPTHSASSGNRDLGNMRQLYRAYYEHIGERDRPNPFDGLSFTQKIKRTRPPFAIDWIQKEFLGSDKLLRLNREARGIVLMMIETGARPSELANLGKDTIHLNGPVPYIVIEPRDDPEDPREIKTASSVRQIPLVGVALEVAKRFPGGFPKYWNKERTLSNTLNKSLAASGLLPTTKHSAYSIRHTFEDRMKEGLVDEELRRALMGHTIDRPKYGEGGSLELKRSELMKIVLPYDPALVAAAQTRKP